MEVPVLEDVFKLEAVPKKGLGLIATTKIEKGARILAERPLLTSEKAWIGKSQQIRSLRVSVSALPAAEKKAFLALHNAFDNEEKEVGIVMSNSFSLGPGADQCGVFDLVSRINHSCSPNCHGSWNKEIEKFTIHTLRDIQKDEEITVSYNEAKGDSAQRRAALKEQFRFDCHCVVCSLPVKQRKASNRRWNAIEKLLYQLEPPFSLFMPAQELLKKSKEVLELFEEEEIVDIGIPILYAQCQCSVMAEGDITRAVVFAERALSNLKVMEGRDSHKVRDLETFIKNPALPPKLKNAGVKPRIVEVPKDLDEEEFEDWLWKTERVENWQVANLRNDSIFPPYDALPHDAEMNEEFYESKDGHFYAPRRHWCFFVEIEDSTTLIRLVLDAKDKNNRSINFSFYTDTRGTEINPALIKKGHTIALMYANSHHFMDGTVGIRHEEPECLKIFPMSLDDLLSLSDRLQTYGRSKDGKRICHGCDKKMEESLFKKCSRCGFFWYCNQKCQQIGWNDRKHKTDCKALKDADLRDLFLLKWHEFQNFKTFPLSGNRIQGARASASRGSHGGFGARGAYDHPHDPLHHIGGPGQIDSCAQQ